MEKSLVTVTEGLVNIIQTNETLQSRYVISKDRHLEWKWLLVD